MESEQSPKMEGMGKEQQDIHEKLSQMMDRPCLSIPHHSQIPLGKLPGQEQNLGAPSVDPFMVPDLDDPYEQEKLKKGLFKQSYDVKAQQMYNSLKERLKAVEDKNALEGVNLDELILVLDLIIPLSSKCHCLKNTKEQRVLRSIWSCIIAK